MPPEHEIKNTEVAHAEHQQLINETETVNGYPKQTHIPNQKSMEDRIKVGHSS